MVYRSERALELAAQGARHRAAAWWNGCCQWGELNAELSMTTERRPAMTDREPTKDASRASKEGDSSDSGKDVMHGRSFAGANIANTEKEQTRERQRVVDSGGESLDEINEVTDAEIEARETNED